MPIKNSILLILTQLAIGVVIVLFGSFVYLFIFNKLFWQLIIADRITHGFWVGLFLLISIGLSYGLIVLGVGEGVRYVGRRFNIEIPFKPVCSGAFLGAPAIVGLIALIDVPWDVFGNQNLIINLIIPIIEVVAYVLSLPIRGWLSLSLPAEVLYIVAIPIGAVLGYRLSKKEVRKIDVQEA